MITYVEVLSWRELGDMIILECISNGQCFEISTYKKRIYNAHLLNKQLYLRLDLNEEIIGIDVRD